MARSDMATTWAIAWPISVPWKNAQLAQADLLDVPRLDVLDAVDVLEVQLELVDDEPLDLVGAHADEVEEDVDLRGIQRREDVHPHPREGQGAEADQADDQHQQRDGMIHRQDAGIRGAPALRRFIGHNQLLLGIGSPRCRGPSSSAIGPVGSPDRARDDSQSHAPFRINPADPCANVEPAAVLRRLAIDAPLCNGQILCQCVRATILSCVAGPCANQVVRLCCRVLPVGAGGLAVGAFPMHPKVSPIGHDQHLPMLSNVGSGRPPSAPGGCVAGARWIRAARLAGGA